MIAGRHRAALLAAAVCLGAATATAQEDARACDAVPDWTKRMTCRSVVLQGLDGERRAASARIAGLSGPAFGRALATDEAQWRDALVTCRAAPYPQQCLEQRHYRRIGWLELVAHTLSRGVPSHDPVARCRRRAETAGQVRACLQDTLADLHDANRLFATALGSDDAGRGDAVRCRNARVGARAWQASAFTGLVCEIAAARDVLARHLMQAKAALQ